MIACSVENNSILQDNDMIKELSKLESFRKELYSFFPKRKDAIMNLLDALTSYGHQCDSVVQLSLADCFKHQYSSITDAIADGLPHAKWAEIIKLIYSYANKDIKHNRFLLDCTAQPRPYARKLSDKTITHFPNAAPGNKPICVGHQYSLLALLPSDAEDKHWLVPISVKRIESNKKGNEEGMNQIVDCIKTLSLTKEINISIGDTLYGTENCRITASKQDNLIHVFRINSKRNVYFAPTNFSEKGRKKEYGNKMILNDENTHRPCDQQEEIQWSSRKGKKCKVIIKSWQNMLLRGSKKFRSSHYPINMVQVKVIGFDGKSVFKRPLWLGVFGKKRDDVNLIDAYQNYIARYDIEHFFRYGKQKLLLNAYQTSDTSHEELWWQFCLLAYAQLYLSKSLVPAIPQQWERYLPEYKYNNENTAITTPSQTQRGFGKLLKKIGTPTNHCIARGKPCGRMLGKCGVRKSEQPIIFKSIKTPVSFSKTILSGFEKKAYCSNPQKIDELVKLIKTTLSKTNFSPEQFAKLLLDSS
jgi:hypothetical protein